MSLVFTTDSGTEPVPPDKIPIGHGCKLDGNPTGAVYMRVGYSSERETFIDIRKGYIPFVEIPSGQLVVMTSRGSLVRPVEITITTTLSQGGN